MRAWEELTFMDCKSGGWRWRKSRATNPERADIPCLATSAAYARMPSRGANVRRSPKIQRLTVGGKSDGVNVFILGLILFQNRLWKSSANPMRAELPTGLRTAKKAQGGKPFMGEGIR